jgi:STAM-binding protein
LAAHSEYYAERGALRARVQDAHAHDSQAQVYEAEGNDAQTYLLLYRHADLVLQKLQGHPDRNKAENRKALNAATAAVSRDLKKLEEIAPRIKKRHEEHAERRRRQQEALESLEGKNGKTLPQELDGLAIQPRGSKRRSYDSRPTIDARTLENRSLAARLAQREVKRRDTIRRGVRQHGVSEEEELARRSGGRWDSWQDELAQEGHGDDLSRQLQEVARLQQNGHRTSHSSVSLMNMSNGYSTDSTASNVSSIIDLPLPIRTVPDSPRTMVRLSVTRPSTCTTTKGTNLEIIGQTDSTTTATSEASSTVSRFAG